MFNVRIYTNTKIRITEERVILAKKTSFEQFSCERSRYRNRRVAQLVSALPSVLEIPSSILSVSNVCSVFSLICVAVALNTLKIEH